jgi:hypothetical protein
MMEALKMLDDGSVKDGKQRPRQKYMHRALFSLAMR